MPLLWGSLAFLLGIWLTSLVKLNAAAWAGLGASILLLAGLLWFAKKRGLLGGAGVWVNRVIAALLLAALFCLGGLRYQRALPTLDASDLAWYNDRGILWEVEGVVIQPPDPRQGYTRLRIQVERARQDGESLFQPLQGRLLAGESPGNWHYGDRLRLVGFLETPQSSELFDYRGGLASQGIHTQMYPTSAYLLQHNQGSPLLAVIYSLRERAGLLLYRLFPGPEAALLAGILLGDESCIASDTQQAFRETGTAHLIAISGYVIVI